MRQARTSNLTPRRDAARPFRRGYRFRTGWPSAIALECDDELALIVERRRVD